MFQHEVLLRAVTAAQDDAGIAQGRSPASLAAGRVGRQRATGSRLRDKTGPALAIAVAGCLVLAGCASGPPPGEPMSGDAYLAAWRGNTSVGRTRDGANFWTYLSLGTEYRGVANYLGRETHYAGQVRTSENMICTQSPQLRGGEERCFEIRREGDTFRTYWDGELWTTATLAPATRAGFSLRRYRAARPLQVMVPRGVALSSGSGRPRSGHRPARRCLRRARQARRAAAAGAAHAPAPRSA